MSDPCSKETNDKVMERIRQECVATPTVEELESEIERLEALLRAAKCPDPGCDGKGTVCRGEYQYENGAVEYDLVQCQWCDERDAALNGEQEKEL